MKTKLITLLITALLIIPMIISPCQISAAEKITKADFKYTLDSEKNDFFKETEPDNPSSWYYQCINSNIETNRGIKIGDSKKSIIKKYGKGYVNINNNNNEYYDSCEDDYVYHYLKEDKNKNAKKMRKIMEDLENKYISYGFETFKKVRDVKVSIDYYLRFYLNKKNKVEMVMFIKNYNNM